MGEEPARRKVPPIRQTAEEEEDIFKEGDVISGRYEVVKRLGKGGYGEIYEAKDLTTGAHVAVKVERVSKPGNLLEEEKIVRHLNERGAKFVPHLLASGRHADSVNYMVMELLGDNLSVLRRRQANHRFSLLTTMQLGIQMLRALKEVHELGYLHRDIKPGNFVMGSKHNGTHKTVILIDYGLSRRHFRPEGGVRPKRKTARWVGSRRYMSINTHQRKDQGRRDDLWSFLYVIIEFFTGTLPWAHLRGIQNLVLDNVRDMKILYNNEKLVRNLPEEFLKFMNHIKELRYEDRPDYEFLHGLMQTLYESNLGDDDTLFDWEVQQQQLTSSRPIEHPIVDPNKRTTGEIKALGYTTSNAKADSKKPNGEQTSSQSGSEQDPKRKTHHSGADNAINHNPTKKKTGGSNQENKVDVNTSKPNKKVGRNGKEVKKKKKKRFKRCSIM